MILRYGTPEGPVFTKEINLTEENPHYMTLLGVTPDEPLYGGVVFFADLYDGIVYCSVYGLTSEGFFANGENSIAQVLREYLEIYEVTIVKTKSTIELLSVDITLEGQEDIMLAPVELPVNISTCCYVQASTSELT